MGLRELVLGGPLGRKDALGAKCARIDSLGLARRRLAKGKEQEELGIEEPGPDDGEVPAASAEEVALQPAEEGDVDSDAELKTPLANRHLNDSLRLARRRFRERASIDIGATARSGAGPSNLANAGIQRASWSSSGTPQAGDAERHAAAGAAGSLADTARQSRSSSPTREASHQVRFRRASDGEYLTRRRKSSDSSRAPGAVGAAAAAMGRLFRKLTANLGTETSGQRPRSATPSRGASPARSRRSSGHGAGGGTSGSHHSDRAQSASSQRRRRSSSDNVADPGSQPPAASAGSASAALASTISRRNKRASAPGEIFFSVGSGSAADVPSPPQGTRPGSAVAAARDGITKGKNWLARLSRGLTTASSGHGSSAAGVTPPRPATAHPAGGGGGGGGSARSSSPLPPVAAGAVVAEAPRSPHHHSGPVGRALGLFARRSDPPAAGASAAGGPEPAKSAKARAQQSGPATAAAAAALADDDDDDTTAADETGGPGAGTLAEAAGGSPTAASVPVPAMP